MNIQKIAVVGSGFMGSGIAQIAAVAGYDVVINDISEDIVEKSRASIEENLARDVVKSRITPENKAMSMERIRLSADLGDLADRDLIIEAVSEKVELKKMIFGKLAAICREDAILATNTSAISVAEIASAATNPARVVGMHFVSPVPKMPLMEIVRAIGTSDETVQTAKTVGEKVGKQCIVAKDSPAFILNRMLDPMINEAINLVETGIGSVEDVDAAMHIGLRHPMGPLELIDMAGIDILLDAIHALYFETNDPKYKPALLLKNMVRMKWLGRKTGIGFYVYKEDGTKYPNPALSFR